MRETFFTRNKKKIITTWIVYNLMVIGLVAYLFTFPRYGAALFLLIGHVFSFISVYRNYKLGKFARFSQPAPVIKFLPVTNNRMRIIWIALNILGLALIIAAACTPYKFANLIVLSIGAALMASSNVFKYYAYKRGRNHHLRVIA